MSNVGRSASSPNQRRASCADSIDRAPCRTIGGRTSHLANREASSGAALTIRVAYRAIIRLACPGTPSRFTSRTGAFSARAATAAGAATNPPMAATTTLPFAPTCAPDARIVRIAARDARTLPPHLLTNRQSPRGRKLNGCASMVSNRTGSPPTVAACRIRVSRGRVETSHEHVVPGCMASNSWAIASPGKIWPPVPPPAKMTWRGRLLMPPMLRCE